MLFGIYRLPQEDEDMGRLHGEVTFRYRAKETEHHAHYSVQRWEFF